MYLKSLAIFKKPSISLKMSSKRIEIFKKAPNSLKISLKCHKFFKKSIAFSKKSLTAIAALPQWPVRPWY
jgi:hypothetical protein